MIQQKIRRAKHCHSVSCRFAIGQETLNAVRTKPDDGALGNDKVCDFEGHLRLSARFQRDNYLYQARIHLTLRLQGPKE